ncbi:MAG: PA4642 family protein [Pseudomonadales bacterium]|jgi:hypothetical protein|nr:PA4642 family protein [Pseudomonadales bacterium]
MKTEKKSGAARTQLAVTDEWWSDERVRSFLALETVAGEHPDYHVLLKAYRGMIPEAFARFVQFFTEAGRNLDQGGPDGRTVLQLMATHRHGGDYADILREAGAR